MADIRYIRVNRFCEQTGYSTRAVEGKIREGVWAEGKHYRRAPDGHILINVPEYEKWVEAAAA